MIKKIIIPIIFALVGTSFVTYSYLDTFILEKKYDVSYDAKGPSNYSFSFAEFSHDDSTSSVEMSSSVSPTSSTSERPNLRTDEYFEDLTSAEINALFTAEKVYVPKERYSDSDIYIDITTHRFEDYCTYYIADIRLKSAQYLKTAIANDTPGENITEKTSEMCIRNKGIIAINGDTYGSQQKGYVMRNGQILRREKNTKRKKPEDLAIYANGTFEIFNERDYTINEIAAKGAYHIFSFGPGLVSNGEIIATENDEVGTALSGNRNQRCAIGIVAPLHYIFMVSDGRIADSPGLSLLQVATIMQEKHCYNAYNFDGGGSATMYFDDGTGGTNGSLINRCHQDWQTDHQQITDPKIEEREVSDIVYIGKE